jgi:hypothetical protein
MSCQMLNKEQVLAALRNVAEVPSVGRRSGRSIYEIAGPAGHFHIDYASFPGGSTGEVPRRVIDELECEGVIERAFPNAPHINSWSLTRKP